MHEPLRLWTQNNQQATFAEDRAAMAKIAREFEGYVDEMLQVRCGAGAQASDDITTSLLRQLVGDRPLRDEEIVSILRNWTGGEVSDGEFHCHRRARQTGLISLAPMSAPWLMAKIGGLIVYSALGGSPCGPGCRCRYARQHGLGRSRSSPASSRWRSPKARLVSSVLDGAQASRQPLRRSLQNGQAFAFRAIAA
ncbi:MAG TPA: hypothetical protein VII31_14175, partial [Caldimonas sp.]